MGDNYMGEDRRMSLDMDWHQHKLKILGDLDDLKSETKETRLEVINMGKAIEVMSTKMKSAVALIAGVISIVVSIISAVIGK